MRKINKTKVAVAIIILLSITGLIAATIIFVEGEKTQEENPNIEKNVEKYKIESKIEGLKGKKVEIIYDENANQTSVDFIIENTTDNNIENISLGIQLIDEKGGVIVQTKTNISMIKTKGEEPISIMLGGNIKTINNIKIMNTETK